ncbi:MAG: hydrogenase expression/formation protein HypE [Candidatus Aminicenantes bacterium]|nr:hydrogenase expression/formation protein HypE [Candidatus Aminicenantes bacterium]
MDRISLSLGSGGQIMKDFLKDLILKHLGNPTLGKFGDSAHLDLSGKIGFTTDSFVIHPLFFPGGNIGKLAVAGTVNDLVVSGVKPRFLSLALILEEGFVVKDLETILSSIKTLADKAGVQVVTGDTKVVRKGEADGIYINTAGIGQVIAEPGNIKDGDLIAVSGTIGDHSVSVMVARGEFEFEGRVQSDCQSLHPLLPLWDMGAKWMRDITRGGLGTILCELGEEQNVPVFIEESKVALSPPVTAVCEILGLDALYLASEGKAVIIIPKDLETKAVDFLRTLPLGESASVIGEIGGIGKKGEVVLKSISGGLRLLEPLTGELLPRIC